MKVRAGVLLPCKLHPITIEHIHVDLAIRRACGLSQRKGWWSKACCTAIGMVVRRSRDCTSICFSLASSALRPARLEERHTVWSPLQSYLELPYPRRVWRTQCAVAARPRGGSAVWTSVSAWARVAPQGCCGATAGGTAVRAGTPRASRRCTRTASPG